MSLKKCNTCKNFVTDSQRFNHKYILFKLFDTICRAYYTILEVAIFEQQLDLRPPPFLSARLLFLPLFVAFFLFDLVVFVYLLEHGRIRLLAQDGGAEVNDLLSPHLDGSSERKCTSEQLASDRIKVNSSRSRVQFISYLGPIAYAKTLPSSFAPWVSRAADSGSSILSLRR